MPDPRIHVEGLAELRKALRTVEHQSPREVGKALKSGVRPAAERGQQLARKGKTHKLERSIRPGVSGVKGFIRSTLIYAGVHEYGGRVGRHRSIRITPSLAMNRAVDESIPDIVERIGDELERLAERQGF